MDSGSPWHVRLRERLRKWWHTENPRQAVIRDVIVAGGVVLFLLVVIWVYAGQPITQAPVVSVESGSMMHGPYYGGQSFHPSPWGNPPFGRIGTIDPGDIVFVKRVGSAESIEVAFDDGGRGGYGGHGDVIVFKPNGREDQTRVIHRAVLYVEANIEGCTPNVDCVYRIPAVCDNPEFTEWAGGQDYSKYCAGSPDPITVQLRRGGLFLDLNQYPCPAVQSTCSGFYSSFVTKGDNNDGPDQVAGNRISGPVRLEWIIGKARGEIPWFGLIKLALYGNPTYKPETDPTGGANWPLLNARAPWDICLSLYFSLAVLIAIPMVIDLINNQRARARGPA